MGSMSDIRKDIMARLGAIDSIGDRPGAKATFGSKRTTAGALRKQLKAQGMTDTADFEWHGISASDPDSTPYWLHEDGSMEKIKADRPGAKAKMGKATDALEYIKNSIASGKTVYVTAGNRTTKVTPQAYAKWEESGKPLFKISSDGALLMASGSSYVRLTLADEMLARVTAMSRPGAKAKFEDNAKLLRDIEALRRQQQPYRSRIYGMYNRAGELLKALQQLKADPSLITEAKALSDKAWSVWTRLETFEHEESKYTHFPYATVHNPKGMIKYMIRLGVQLQKSEAEIKENDKRVRALAKKAKVTLPFSKHGRKVRAGIMDRIGAAASALTASPVDPTSSQYRQQLSAAKKAAQDAVGNYKFMRDKAKLRQDAMDKYVTAAIKTINASTNVQDVEHFADQIKIAVRALSTMLSSVKTPFSRPGAKAKFGMTNAGYKALVDAIRQYGDSAPAAVMAQAKQMKQEPTEFTDNEVMAVIAKMKQARASRPGAKVTAGRAEDLYRKLSSGSITYANAKEWERLVTEALRLPDYTPPGGDMSLHEIAEDLGGDLMALKTHSGPVPHAKAKAEKPSDLEREDVKAGLKVMAASDPAVSDKIRTLIAEGKPQDQAVAIALDMKRRGEL